MSKKNPTKSSASGKPNAKSTSKPIAIVAIGAVVALGLAVSMSRVGEEEPTVAATGSTALVTADANHVTGPESASVTLIEFGDFQCPTCGAFHPVLKALLARFPDDLKLEFHHMPLVSIHPNAMPGAMAAEAAGIQGRFWEMNDLLFQNQQAWSLLANPESAFTAYAESLALDMDQFARDMRSEQVQDRILTDVRLSQAENLEGTPSFYVNDKSIPIPPSYQEFERIIYDAIQSSSD